MVKNKIYKKLEDSFQLASQVLSVVVIFHLLDHLELTTVLPDTGIIKNIAVVSQFIILTLAKVVLLSGGLGNIACIALGTSDLLSKECLLRQVKRFWSTMLLLSLVPSSFHFLIYLISGHYMAHDQTKFVFDIPLLVCFCLSWASSQNDSIKIKRVPLDMISLSIVILVYCFVNISALLSSTYLNNYPLVKLSLSFALNVIELATFIFSIKSVYSLDTSQSFIKSRQLILVNPPFSGTVQALSSLAIGFYPPIFVVLKALTPRSYSIKEYNRIIWRRNYYQGNALVAITCLTANSAEAYKIAKDFRRHGAKVIMGGPHVSIFPNEALEFCDSVVIGPVESVWRDILHDYEENNLKRSYNSSPKEEDVAQVRSFLAEETPAVIANFLSSRKSCKFKCYFCANPALQKGIEERSNEVDQMVVYLQKIATRYKSTSFIDTNIYADPDYMKRLLGAMIPLGLKWTASASIDIAADDEAVRLLKDSGCRGLLIGYEISSESDEIKRGGKLSIAHKYLELSAKLKKAGIGIKGHFIYGFENDNFFSLVKLWTYCLKLCPETTVLSFLTPIPGSVFFDEIIKANKLRDLNWRSYNLHTLVYDNPRLDNIIYRKFFSLVMLFFLCTTSVLGRMSFIALSALLYLTVHFGT